jgi:hypothetical protein
VLFILTSSHSFNSNHHTVITYFPIHHTSSLSYPIEMGRTTTLPADPEKASGLEGRNPSFQVPRSVTVLTHEKHSSTSATREYALKRQNSVSFMNGPQKGDTASRIVGEFRYVPSAIVDAF